jgi:cell division protein FtsQ
VRLGLGLVVLLACAATGWMWLRDSSLVAVKNVEITGVTASDGDLVKSSLEAAALEMTTLHVREQALRDATDTLSSVASLQVSTDFPHTLRIHVTERRAVAAVGKERVPVTGDGIVMNGVSAARDLPSLAVDDGLIESKITDRRALRALTIAGAAPEELLQRISKLSVNRKGVVASLKNGPELVFGSADEARAKWIAAARVLAETSAAGATYLDLRIPGRVAAGGLAPIEPAGQDPNAQPEGENSPTLNAG